MELVPNTQVRIKAIGNCYCAQLFDQVDDFGINQDQTVAPICDYCQTNGKVGILVTINEHNEDGDFYGVQLSGETNTIFFFKKELIPLTECPACLANRHTRKENEASK